MKFSILILISVLLIGCATSKGFNKADLRSSISNDVVVTEASIKKALEAKPQLPKPFRLAIYYSEPKSTHYYYGSSWNWLPDDKKIFESELNSLIDSGEVSEVISINRSIVEGEGNVAIRLAAARAGADAVIIVNGVADIDKYNNPLGVTYLLLVTGMFVPGTELDALTMINATMWDVRNEYLYLSVDSENTVNVTAPSFFIEEEHAINKAKIGAMEALGKYVISRISKMANK
ncbi:MAG: hypothetical protein MI976_12170 [Pseudomonadales bacterium]|nr:hypothetical protein [Pseudomonadales bacterium]